MGKRHSRQAGTEEPKENKKRSRWKFWARKVKAPKTGEEEKKALSKKFPGDWHQHDEVIEEMEDYHKEFKLKELEQKVKQQESAYKICVEKKKTWFDSCMSEVSKFDYAEDEIDKLKATQEELSSKDLMKAYIAIVKQLLKRMKEQIEALVTFSENESKSIVEYDEKDQYKAYGLLLSASKSCNSLFNTNDTRFKLTAAINPVKELCLSNSQEKQSTDLQKYCMSSIKLTEAMLILLPPLVIGKVEYYDEELCDTNRATWNETKMDSLQWYRPILVCGNNKFHVAMKGLVGNVTFDQQPLASEPEDVVTLAPPLKNSNHSQTIISEEATIDVSDMGKGPIHEVEEEELEKSHKPKDLNSNVSITEEDNVVTENNVETMIF